MVQRKHQNVATIAIGNFSAAALLTTALLCVLKQAASQSFGILSL